MENNIEKLLSVDKPYLDLIPQFNYDPNFCKRTTYEMVLNRAHGHYNIPAMNFYGNITSTLDFIKNTDIVAKCYASMGIGKDDNVSFFGLNTPEIVESLYALNKVGAVSEWFNPNAMTPELLRNHINTNKVKALFVIDIMYPIVKEAIKGTDVQFVVVNSLMDSLPKSKGVLYYLKMFGLDSFTNLDHLKRYKEGIYKRLESVNNLEEKQQIIEDLNLVEKIVYNVYDYCYKDKIFAKMSFYNDKEKDSRFITWHDFIKNNYDKDMNFKRNYDFEKMSMVIHTGGTTGPIKRIAMNDYAMNSGPYQISLMPNTFELGDSILQITPPMVAWSLESMHTARYFNMTLNMIASYDRDEFAKIILSTKTNHYFTVPSFVKRIKEDPIIEGKDLSFIKTIFQGGEGIAPEDDKEVDEVLEKGGSKTKSALGFGQNEEFAGFFINLYMPGVDKVYGTCGIPLAGNDYIIYDLENKKELPYGKDENGNYRIGALLVSGPSTMIGYIGDDEYLNEKTIININGKKYIDTGDLAYADENGRMFYYTREQRIIRTQQGKIFANVIENLLKQLDEIDECCVVKMPDPINVAQASCHIVLKEKYRNLPIEEQEKVIEKIISFVESKTKEMYTYYVPGSYEFRSEKLPLTAFGKTAYKELEKANEKEYEESGKQLKKIRIK